MKIKAKPEDIYIETTNLKHRKKYAQFFTPEIVAEFMAKWLLELQDFEEVLEPAIGLGVFSRVLLKQSKNIKITGFDVDKNILDKLLELPEFKNENIIIKNEDYLSNNDSKKYDGIICNPPYLKFHEYDNTSQVELLNSRLGTTLTKSSNLYVLFLLKAINELRLGGRATFIIPSEFLNSNYGVVIKEHLVQSGMLRHLFIVNSDSNVFEDATTTTTIIFLENSKSDEQVKFYNIDNIEQFNSDYQELVPFFQIPNNELQPRLKWRRYYEIENSQFYSNLIDFSEYARVRRGIATGANDYFLFNKTKAKEYGIPKECLVPTITKANQIKTNFFNNTDLEELIEQDKKVFLFDGLKASNEQSVQDYINEGVKQSVNERYLTKSKKPWFRLEERRSTNSCRSI